MVLGKYVLGTSEIKKYSVDYSEWLNDGELLVGVTFDVGLVTTPPLVITDSVIDDTSAVVTFYAQGGDGKSIIPVGINVTTSLAQIKTDTINFASKTSLGPGVPAGSPFVPAVVVGIVGTPQAGDITGWAGPNTLTTSDVLSRPNLWTGVQTYSVPPIVPTQSHGDNTTKAASTAFVQAALSGATFDTSQPYTWTALQTFSGGLTATAINLPGTTSSSAGVFTFNNQPFLSIYHNNLFVGQIAGNFTLTGTGNTGVGTLALNALTLGSDNTVGGNSAGSSLTGGGSNCAWGVNALLSEQTGSFNFAGGKSALFSQNGASGNLGIGNQAGFDVLLSSNNIFIGNNTGRGIQNGAGCNVVIGNAVTGLSSTLSNAIIFADGAGTIRADYGLTKPSAWTFSGPITGIGQEALAVTATNTLAALSNTYSGAFFLLTVNGQTFTPVGGSPPFTVSGTTVTWSAANAGFSLQTTDVVSAVYSHT